MLKITLPFRTPNDINGTYIVVIKDGKQITEEVYPAVDADCLNDIRLKFYNELESYFTPARVPTERTCQDAN